MRILILIALLFTFTVGSYVDMASATSGHAHVNAHTDQNGDTGAEPCHSGQGEKQDQTQCDDCCCIHSHSMAPSMAVSKNGLNLCKQGVIASLNRPYSAELSALKRPPRL